MLSDIGIATRNSPLALKQTHAVIDALKLHFPKLHPTIHEVHTRKPERLDDGGLKGVFTKAIDEVVLSGTADIAIHSGKDLPSELDQDLCIAAILKRADPRDVFISQHYTSIESLPKGATIGSSSLRRKMFIQHLRPDITLVPIQGNIHTRLEKGAALDGIVLAAAGLCRLGLEASIQAYLNTDIMVPAASQGAIIVTCKKKDHSVINMLAPLNDALSAHCVMVERQICHALSLDCHAPIGVHASIQNKMLTIHAGLLWEQQFIAVEQQGALEQTQSMTAQVIAEIEQKRGFI